MRPPKTSRLYDFAAAGLAAALALTQIVWMIASKGFTSDKADRGVLLEGIVLCLVLAATAVGLLLHRKTGWLLGVFGMLLSIGYGIFTRASGHPIGIVFMMGGAALFVLIVKSLHWYRTPLPSETGTRDAAPQRR